VLQQDSRFKKSKPVLLTRMSKFLVMGFAHLLAVCAFANDTIRVDLSERWEDYGDGRFVQHNNNSKGQNDVIHLTLLPGDSGILEVKADHSFSVFLGKRLLLKDSKKLQWQMDSLRENMSLPARFAFYSKGGVSGLATRLIQTAEFQNVKFDGSAFRQTIIIVSFALVFFLLLLHRAYPLATRDYFNIIKLFSARQVDEGTLTLRVTSANNVLIYLFCSLLTALSMFIYFSRGGGLIGSLPQGGYLLQMAVLAVIVFVLLILKMVIIGVVSRIFRLAEFAPGQFYNFVRLLLIGFGFSFVAMVLNFMIGCRDDVLLSILSYSMMVMLVVFFGSTFLKLSASGGFTRFHLFSYLCASEIIPMLILLNLFFI
jgi:Domain of unknown function (DUF4271)